MLKAETLQIKLTPTKLEQLEYIARYQKAFMEIDRDLEELARELLYDAIRAKYNYYREKHTDL